MLNHINIWKLKEKNPQQSYYECNVEPSPLVEHGTFTSSVFSLTGGECPEISKLPNKFIRRKIAEEKYENVPIKGAMHRHSARG